jgi:hypothetical protein
MVRHLLSLISRSLLKLRTPLFLLKNKALVGSELSVTFYQKARHIITPTKMMLLDDTTNLLIHQIHLFFMLKYKINKSFGAPQKNWAMYSRTCHTSSGQTIVEY